VTQPILDRQIQLKARTFAARLDDVKSELTDRDEAVDLIALATLCREHALLIGPPGTAKTFLMEQFRRLLDVRCFSYLLTRFTEPAELFGPMDFRSFREDRVYRVNSAGMLPEADIAFLDEVFQGSSAILNSLLTLINERRFYNGGEVVETNLITLLGSSNGIPDDPLLAAFSDRFLLRHRLDYVQDDSIEDMLRLGWQNETDRIRAAVNGTPAPAGPAPGVQAVGFPVSDLIELQQALAGIDLTPVRGLFTHILQALRAEGVSFSDRRAVKAQKTFAAAAMLAGRARAEPADLAPLIYLWTSPDDEPAIRRVVADHDVPVEDRSHVVRDPAEISYELAQLRRQQGNVRSAEEFREVLRRVQRVINEVRRDHPDSQQVQASLLQLRDELLRAYRERYGEEGFYA
jgi:MoxR-like ATPase